MNTKHGVRSALHLAITALAVLALAAPAHGFRMIQNTTAGRVTSGNLVTCNDPGGFVHWGQSNIAWRHNTGGQGAGAATALQNAMASWTGVGGADHTLSYAGTTTAGWSTDGINTLLWANGNNCTGSCLALTALVLQQPGQIIVESDITFNAAYTWNTNGLDHDIEAVAAHELGHSLGIHHTEVTSTPRPTMYASYFGTTGRALEADDQAALQCSQNRYPFSGVPATPASLTVTPEYCYAYASLDWSSSAAATSYEVQQASSSTFTGAFTVYSGPDTFYWVSSGTGTRYFRVRACNFYGCSGWRAGNRSAPYSNVCM